MLQFYFDRFDTVEINNSFYRLPAPETFEDWREQSPPKVTFAVKASRFITHNKKLRDPEIALENLLPRVELLGEKLGPVLFQLPPKWNVNLARLEEFLEALPRTTTDKRLPHPSPAGRGGVGHLKPKDVGRPRRWHYAFEFRNPTWLVDDLYPLLRRYNAAFCIFDLAGFQTPLKITADWTYVRLHGPGGKYQGNYSHGQLAAWAERLRTWAAGEVGEAYVFFDNDQAGYAAQNALTLKQMVQGKQQSPRAA
jgi:uncharacterized protein YecE (DUF72 family)